MYPQQVRGAIWNSAGKTLLPRFNNIWYSFNDWRMNVDTVSNTTRTGEAASTRDPASNPVEPALPHFAEYEILGVLGRGGMGVVYQARDRNLKRLVALKMILAGPHASREQYERFQTEAEAVARIDHPNIVQIYGIGEHNNLPYFSLEFVDGGSLQQRLNGTPMVPALAADLLLALADAMAAAHRNGVIHRDLKPANILLTAAGVPKISDFGLAKQLDADSSHTQSGQVFGSPSYMAPEQAAGESKAVGPASDIYALGAILYEMLTGHPPFRAATMLDTLKQVRSQEPIPPSRLQPIVPADLETICLKCLSKEPRKRYESAAALADDLRRFREGRPILARPVGRVERTWRWCRRNPVAAGLIASLALGIVAAAGLTVWALDERGVAKKKTGEAEELAKREADQRERTEEALARSLLARVRENSISAPPGWTWQALEDLAEARKLRPGLVSPAEWRSRAADCFGRADLREIDLLAEGLQPAALAFSADGRFAAVAEFKNAIYCTILVYDTSTRNEVRRLTFQTVSTSAANVFSGQPGYYEAIRSVEFSPDGRWLVAGTRLGRICRWDLAAADAPSEIWQAHPKSDSVLSLCFTADSRHLVSCSDTKVNSWSVADGWKGTPLGWKGGYSAAMLPGGNRVALLTYEGLRFFELGGTWSQPTKPERVSGRWLDVSRDGRIVAVQGGREIQLVDARTGVRFHTIALDDSSVAGATGVSFSSDGSLLAGSWGDNRVRIWETGSGRKLGELFIANRTDPQVLFSPDGRFLLIGGDRRTHVYELRPADIRYFAAPHPAPVVAAHFADSRTLACTAERQYDNRIVRSWSTEWDIDSGLCKRESRTMAMGGGNSCFHPANGAVMVHPSDGTRVVSTSLLGATTPRSPVPFEVPGFERVLSVGPEEFTRSAGVELREDPKAGGKSARIPARTGAGVRARAPVAFKKTKAEGWSVWASVRVERRGMDGAAFQAAMITPAKTIKRDIELEAVQGDEYHDVQCELIHAVNDAGHASIDFAIDAADGANDATAIWVRRIVFVPVRARHWAKDLIVPSVEHLAYSPNGSRLWGIVNEDTVAGWEHGSFRLAAKWGNPVGEGLFGFKRTQALAAGNRWVVAANEMGQVDVLDTDRARKVGGWFTPDGGIRSLALDASESRLWIGTQKGTIRSYSVPDGKALGELPPHADSVESLQFSRDGLLLVSGSGDRTTRIWRVGPSGEFEPLLTLPTQSGRIISASLSPDNTALAIVARPERSVSVWRLDRLNERLKLLDLGW